MADKLGSAINAIIAAAETLLASGSLTALQREDLQQIYGSAQSIRETLAVASTPHGPESDSNRLTAVSPEMRAQLQSIIGFSQMLVEHPDMYDAPLSQAQAAHFQAIYEGGNRLLWMVDEIIDYTKIREGTLQLRHDYFPLAPVIEATVAEAAQNYSIAFYAQPPTDLPDAFGDKLRTRQLLAHLLANAAQATHEGYVQVEAQIGQDNVGREVLAVSVADTGVGIAPECHHAIFEPFWQTPPVEGPGLGLGLYIASSLAVLQGGELWFESQPGAGSTFTFTLPTRPD